MAEVSPARNGNPLRTRPSGAKGTRIQIDDCNRNRTAAQEVTVTRTGRLKMRDMCLDIANGAANGAAVSLTPCAGVDSEVWQFR